MHDLEQLRAEADALRRDTEERRLRRLAGEQRDAWQAPPAKAAEPAPAPSKLEPQWDATSLSALIDHRVGLALQGFASVMGDETGRATKDEREAIRKLVAEATDALRREMLD